MDIQTVVLLKQHILTPLSIIQSIVQIALANMVKISQTKPRRWNNGYYSDGVEGLSIFFSFSLLLCWFAQLNSQSRWPPSPTGSAAETERPVGSEVLATDRLPGVSGSSDTRLTRGSPVLLKSYGFILSQHYIKGLICQNSQLVKYQHFRMAATRATIWKHQFLSFLSPFI